MDSNACKNNGFITELQQTLPDNQNLTFPDSCTMTSGAICAIVATVLWFAAAVAALKVDPPERSPITVQTEEVTYTKTKNPDGTEVVSENVVKGTPVVVGQGGQEAEKGEQAA